MKEKNYNVIQFPSRKKRKIQSKCYATIGRIGNPNHFNKKLKKAGEKRWKGIRPHVRGSAMNPCDHPHGGGEGRSPIGNKQPCTPWGKPALGIKTRKKKRYSNNLII